MTEIRRLPASRWKDYKALRLESLKQSPLAFGGSFEEESMFKEKEWKKRMKGVDFAVDHGAPVGMIVLSFNKELKFRHIAEIYSFYVKPSHRGMGVGTALLERALWRAQNNERIVKTRLYVNSRQRSAVRMYEKAGFEIVGSLDREMRVGARFYTMLIMEKRMR